MFDERSFKALPKLVSVVAPLAPMAYASVVGALSLFPANSHKIPSLEGLAHLAACDIANGASRVTPQVVKQLAQLTKQWSGGADDPAEAPTMANVATPWGDYRVFTCDPQTAYRVSCLVSALARARFPPELEHKLIAALAVSEAVAQRARIDAPDSILGTIFVPSNAQLRTAADAVVFADDELASLLADVGCTVEDLYDITLPYEERPPAAFPQMGDRLQEHAPLLRIEDKTIVYAPRFLSLAALNAVVAKCPVNARLTLSLAYHEHIVNRVTRCLRVLGHRDIARVNVGTIEAYAITSCLRWTCDQRKQLTTTVVTELLPVCPVLGETWRIPDPLPAPLSRRPITGCGVGETLHLFVFAHLARWPHAEVTPAPNERVLTLRADELEAMSQARLANRREPDWNLEFWRYYEATHTNEFTGFALTFLDQYAMWRSREQRIVRGLEEPPDWLQIQPGFGIKVREEALKTEPTAKRFHQRNTVLLMVPTDRKFHLYEPYFKTGDEFVWYLQSTDTALWFTANAYADPGFVKLTRALAFWIPHLPSAVRSALRAAIPLPIHVEWVLGRDEPVIATSSQLERAVIVTISEQFWTGISETSNEHEVTLIRRVARELLSVVDQLDLDSELERFEAEMTRNPLRRTLHALRSNDHPGLMFRERLPPQRRISLHDRTMVRRAAAAAMAGAASPTHAAVEAIFSALENDVRGHDAAAALRTLMEHIEAFAADRDSARRPMRRCVRSARRRMPPTIWATSTRFEPKQSAISLS